MSKNIIVTCVECAFCNDAGTDPQNVGRRIYNCHYAPPSVAPIGSNQGVVVMSLRPTITPSDLACSSFKPIAGH